MSEASYASLGPTLLARKGGARPAMRPQLAPLPETLADDALEDLGWNDMGGDEFGGDEIGGDDKSPQSASADMGDNASFNVVPLLHGAMAAQPHSPIVQRQQRNLDRRVLADAAMAGPEDEDEDEAETPAAAAMAPDGPEAAPGLIRTKARKGASPAPAKAHRAAFTLRLDPDRHLKLRLAATMQGVSAQSLVTGALDAMLHQITDLDAIAERMKRH